jgi:hypothetical protein
MDDLDVFHATQHAQLKSLHGHIFQYHACLFNNQAGVNGLETL